MQPIPYADSLRTGGTISKTSRITEAIKGRIIIAKIKPAQSMPIPLNAPEKRIPNPGTCPKVAAKAGCIYSAKIGAKINRPNIP